MTAYHGGKQRIGNKIAAVMLEESLNIADNECFDIKGYCEPFAGMLGVYQHIPKLFQDEMSYKLEYKAGDMNGSVVKMWEKAKTGWIPPEENYPKEEWLALKKNNKTSAIKGFAGHANTFRGQFFDSYFKHQNQKIKTNSNRVVEVAKKLKANDVTIKEGSYTQFSGLKGYVIYCDPPYRNTVSRYYHGSGTKHRKSRFDSETFWEWCRKMAEFNIVFVSEYNAPDGALKKVWSKSSGMTGNIHKSKQGNVRTENLYLLLKN